MRLVIVKSNFFLLTIEGFEKSIFSARIEKNKLIIILQLITNLLEIKSFNNF
jgi:hypothetical protein